MSTKLWAGELRLARLSKTVGVHNLMLERVAYADGVPLEGFSTFTLM
jgi:hypothetical protein